MAASDVLFFTFCVWGLLYCDLLQQIITLTSSASAWAAKHSMDWRRPNGSPCGYPSGHTQLVFSVVWWQYPHVDAWVLAAAAAMPLLRVLEGKHTPAQAALSVLWPLPMVVTAYLTLACLRDWG